MHTKGTTIIPLEMLLLNDLLRVNAIDIDIYNKAAEEIMASKTNNTVPIQQPLPISA